jgi:hypothetical protein
MRTKTEADYQDNPNGREQCSRCSMFRPPHRCTLVKGDIAPMGWCKYWEPRNA